MSAQHPRRPRNVALVLAASLLALASGAAACAVAVLLILHTVD